MKKVVLWRWMGVLVLLLGLLGQAGLVLAHANLVRSDPAAGAVLPQSPAMVTLEFSENLDLGFSNVHLTDASSQVVVKGPGMSDPASPRVLMLALPPLPNGVYSAIWQARSAADGHVTVGSVGFSVGVAAQRASLLPPPGTPDPATALPPLADTILRWLSFLATSVGIGSLLFGPLVWRPAYAVWKKKGPADHAAVDDQAGRIAADERATRILRGLALGGTVSLVVLTAAYLCFQAWQLAQAGFWQALGQLLAGRTGLILEARLGLLVLLAVLTSRLPAAGSGRMRLWGLAALLGGGVLLTFSLVSHAVSLYPPNGVIFDWLHLFAMSAWFGGLLPLLVLLRQRDSIPLSALVPRFSMVALPSVGVMALTGLTSGLFHVMSPQALVSTSYGRVLIFKVVLFGLLFLMGAVNLLVLSPRLQAAKATNWLCRTVRTEIVTGLLVVLAAGILADSAPAFEALQAEQQLGVMQTAQSGGVKMVLRVAPAQAGNNELAVDVTDRRPRIDATKNTVLLRLQMMDASTGMGVTQVETVTQDHFRYSAQGSYLSMAGRWQIEVIVRQPGVNDERHAFVVAISDMPSMGVGIKPPVSLISPLPSGQ